MRWARRNRAHAGPTPWWTSTGTSPTGAKAHKLSSEHLATLAEMNAFSQAGRYPETLSAAPTAAEADGYLTQATEVFEWLMSRL